MKLRSLHILWLIFVTQISMNLQALTDVTLLLNPIRNQHEKSKASIIHLSYLIEHKKI